MGEAINLVENFKVEKVIFNCGEFNDLEQESIKVLNKKKIRLTILIVFVLVFGVAILKDNKESVPTVSLPVSGKTIVIDAGHR